MFLGFNGLVQAFGIPAADHQAAGELIHDDYLAVLHHIVHIPFHQVVGAQGAVYMVVQLTVFRVVDVLNVEGVFHLLGTLIREGNRLFLFLHFEVDTGLHGADHRVHPVVQLGALFSLAGNNQRRTGFIDQDGVDFVHDGEGMAPLHQVVLADHHVVPQVIEAQFVIGSVGNVAGIGSPAFLGLQVMDNQADAQSQEAVHLAHPLAVPAGQVIVHRHNVDAFPPQGVQISRHGCHQGFTFTGFHFRNPALVQHDTAQHLYPEGAHSQHPVRGFADSGESLRQNIVFRFAILQSLSEFGRLGLQLFIGQRTVFFLQRHDRLDGFLQFL